MPTLHDIAAGALLTPAEAHALAADLHAETIAAVRARFGASAARGSSYYQSWRHGPPVGAIVHVPALSGRSALDGLDLSRRFMQRGGGKSTHVVIDWPSGEVRICAPLVGGAWHAGKPWNHTHLGIDIVSPGPVRTRKGGGWSVPHGDRPEVLLPTGDPLPDSCVVDFGGARNRDRPWRLRHWHAVTPAQVRALGTVLRLMRMCYPDTLDPSSVIRHADIAPGRRVDPGPCVPLELVRDWGWSCEDITGALDGLAGEEWHDWLRAQWASPVGLITDADRKLPGRPEIDRTPEIA